MRPPLFSLRLADHDLALPSYGLLVAVGCALAITLVWREGRRQGFDGGRLLDLCFWGLVLGLVGSRVTYVALNARDFALACIGGGGAVAHGAGGGRLWGCTAALRFWEGGLVFYGGVITAAIVVLRFCRRERWSFWKVGDLFAPALALGHAVGRLGCLAAGCCFGAPCAAPWALRFGPGSVAFAELAAGGALPPEAAVAGAAARTPPLHPTQLYEAAGELGIFLVLLALRGRERRGHPALRSGTLLLVYAAAYAALRFGVEMFRGDLSRRLVTAWLSTSQLASLVVLAAVLLAAWHRRRPPGRVTGP
jgi:phosphatidylglycerol:prolipoprotein diacylglycerol transferase